MNSLSQAELAVVVTWLVLDNSRPTKVYTSLTNFKECTKMSIMGNYIFEASCLTNRVRESFNEFIISAENESHRMTRLAKTPLQILALIGGMVIII